MGLSSVIITVPIFYLFYLASGAPAPSLFGDAEPQGAEVDRRDSPHFFVDILHSHMGTLGIPSSRPKLYDSAPTPYDTIHGYDTAFIKPLSAFGMVRGPNGNCSGTLISRSLVLTDRSCLSEEHIKETVFQSGDRTTHSLFKFYSQPCDLENWAIARLISPNDHHITPMQIRELWLSRLEYRPFFAITGLRTDLPVVRLPEDEWWDPLYTMENVTLSIADDAACVETVICQGDFKVFPGRLGAGVWQYDGYGNAWLYGLMSYNGQEARVTHVNFGMVDFLKSLETESPFIDNSTSGGGFGF